MGIVTHINDSTIIGHCGICREEYKADDAPWLIQIGPGVRTCHERCRPKVIQDGDGRQAIEDESGNVIAWLLPPDYKVRVDA